MIAPANTQASLMWRTFPDKASAHEAAALFKTTSEMLDRLTLRLGELHPYDTAAIAGWRNDAAHPATLE